MATLLCKAIDATNPDPVKDARGCYKRGDVVLVRPDDHPWGRLEVLPPAQGGKFARIVISDVTRAQVVNWVRNNWQCEIDGTDGEVRRRRVRIDIALLPNNVRNALNNNGVFTTTWATVREYLRNKATNATAAGSAIGGA